MTATLRSFLRGSFVQAGSPLLKTIRPMDNLLKIFVHDAFFSFWHAETIDRFDVWYFMNAEKILYFRWKENAWPK